MEQDEYIDFEQTTYYKKNKDSLNLNEYAHVKTTFETTREMLKNGILKIAIPTNYKGVEIHQQTYVKHIDVTESGEVILITTV